MGQRHNCQYGTFHPHTRGDGAPKRKKCAYCGGAVLTYAGTYGVFVWRGDGRYPLAEAVRTFERERAAETWAQRNSRKYPDAAGGLVVRWIPETPRSH